MPPSSTTTTTTTSSSSLPPQQQLITLNFVQGQQCLPTEDDYFDSRLQHRFPHLFQTLSESCPDVDTCVEIRILPPTRTCNSSSSSNQQQQQEEEEQQQQQHPNNTSAASNNNNRHSSSSLWKPVLQLVTNSFPRLISLSIIVNTIVLDGSSFSHRHYALHLSTDVTQCILQDAPQLQSLSLQTTGLMVDGGGGGCFQQLAQAIQQHQHLQQISFRNVYFCPATTQQRHRGDAWLFPSCLVQALCGSDLRHSNYNSSSSSSSSSNNTTESGDLTTSATRQNANTTTTTSTTTTAKPTLTHLTITTATKYYVRPILTLAALNAALQHASLEQLHLEHFTVWGGGTTLQCADSLQRPDCTLQTLCLRDCVFAGSSNSSTTTTTTATTTNEVDAEAAAQGDNNNNNNNNNNSHHRRHNDSILAGLQNNTSIQVLDLTGSLLHLEAAGLTASVATNTTLQVLCLNGAKLGFEVVTHGEHLVRLLTAVGETSTSTTTTTKNDRSALTELQLQDLWSDDWNQQDLDTVVPLVLKAVLQTVQMNRNLTRVHLNGNHTTSCLRHDDDLMAEISLIVGLNRAKYWDFLQTSSSCLDTWMTALSRIAVHDDEKVGEETSIIPILFHMLRDHPLMMVCRQQ